MTKPTDEPIPAPKKGFRISASFWTSKTTWTAIAAIVTAIGGFATKQATLFQTLAAIYAALGVIGLRDTIAKGLNE